MILAGIDYSITSPAICVCSTDEPFSFTNCKFLSINGNKKLVDDVENVIIKRALDSTHLNVERYDNLAKHSVDFLLQHNVDCVAMESDAYGSSAGQVFNIGEYGGILKHRMWTANISVEDVAPAQLKKFATSKGNANKQAMLDQFVKDEGVDLHDFFNMKRTKTIKAPITDIVDAYYLAKHAYTKYTNIKGV